MAVYAYKVMRSTLPVAALGSASTVFGRSRMEMRSLMSILRRSRSAWAAAFVPAQLRVIPRSTRCRCRTCGTVSPPFQSRER